MSADSPRRASRKGSTGHVVLPRPVSDPSIIDSLAGFIHEVVPQAYSSVLPGESREAVVWARFEQADYNDPGLYPDTGDDCDATAPLLLVLGYGNGVQVWSVPASGEAVEVLSWNQRVVRTLRFLPAPESNKSALQSDPFAHKRPLVAMVDNTGPGPHFCSVNFISLHGGDQVKSIKFKNPVNDVLANRRSIVTTFPEKIAVFDALTLEDRMTVTTCYPSPGINPNPVSLGSRWLAYADRRLVSWWRSQGGCEGEGAQSYTATVLHAAKSLGKGLRDLSGSVASSLTGTGIPANMMNGGEMCTPGIISVLDIEGNGSVVGDQVIAHFVAHCEPIVALSFDPSGLLLLTVDKCGHRFHLFRIHPHPSGPSLCEVHHLYTLHRGDTTARIQDIAFSNDSRWVAVSSLRGTTHVFPITPYGGPISVRTHTTPHVVNRLSRFHRSAGLSAEGGRNSPVAHDGPPLTPPLPARSLPTSHAITVQAHAQLRHQVVTPSSSEDTMVRLTACFALPRACLPGLLPSAVSQSSKNTRRALDSLYVMACHGRLIQYDLDPRHVSGISKDRVCDDTAVELLVDPKAEWIVLRPPLFNPLQPPLSSSNPLLTTRPESTRLSNYMTDKTVQNNSDEHWLSQVEIMTHAGPHRRLWMGPQFTFKTYSLTSSDVEKESVEVGSLPVRSNPVNMPIHPHLLIESGSASSLEQSPHLTEVFENSLGQGESRLREDLADAMLESPGSGPRSAGNRSVWVVGGSKRAAVVERLVNPLGTVITIDPEQVCPAPGPGGGSPHLTTDLIIVPARSASLADPSSSSSKVHRNVNNCDVEVPPLRCKTKPTKTEIGTSPVVTDHEITSLEKVDDSNLLLLCDKNSLNANKAVGKTNNKEKRKNGNKKSDKRFNSESIENNLKPDMDVNISAKPSVSDPKLTNDVNDKKENASSISVNYKTDLFIIPGDKGKNHNNNNSNNNNNNSCSKKSNKHNRKCESGSVLESVGCKSSKVDEVTIFDVIEPVVNDSVMLDDDVSSNVMDKSENFTCWNRRTFSDCLKNDTDDKENLNSKSKKESSEEPSEMIVDEPLVERKRSVIENNVQPESDPVERSTTVVYEKSEHLTMKSNATVAITTSKNKRKCKTLGKKIKINEGNDNKTSSCKPSVKLDEIDLLESQQTVESKLNEVPDLVLSNTMLDFSVSEKMVEVNIDEDVDDKHVLIDDDDDVQRMNCEGKEENLSDIIESKEEKTNADEEIEILKTQNEETSDKDSSDDSERALKTDVVKSSGQKRRKSNRKLNKESETEMQSDSDTNIDKSGSSCESNPSKISENVETIDEPIVSVKPKMSWSRIVSMGKQDANGNFSNTDADFTNQSENNGSNNPASDEKETNVKTGSTEDRGSVYESCSESVGEETGFESEQQQPNETVFETPDEQKNSDNELNTINSDSSLCQIVDDESFDKSNTDSGEKDSGDNQSNSKKSRKSKRKRR